ncbi:MAG: hypothetical protein Q7U53_11130 [Anaerolineaceae bacterium]|nr:hypothetical protein [Anaerolineaceae bacterium]
MPIHDDWNGDVNPQVLEMLTRLTGGGFAQELGIGTGRVSLPLTHSGVKMYGINHLSPITAVNISIYMDALEYMWNKITFVL